MITEVRKGRTYLNENQILMLAEAVGEDKEKALIGLALDKSKSYEAQQAWTSIAKKFNGLGLSSISMASGALALLMYTPKEALAQCALCLLKLNATNIIINAKNLNSLTFERVNHEVSRNDQKLYFS